MKLEKPWMTDDEIQIIEHVLKTINPKDCLEYGGGGSTIYFGKYAQRFWHCIEHNRIWYERILQNLPKGNEKIWVSWRDKPHRYIYAEHQHFERGFNFILIDGWKRAACSYWTPMILTPLGVLVMHDTKYPEFFDEDAMSAFRYNKLFDTPDGIWVASKERNLEDLFEGMK